jgi:tetratricopeptide (TPR) repeat protein
MHMIGYAAAAAFLAATFPPAGAVSADTATCAYRYMIAGQVAESQARYADAQLAYLRALKCDESSAYLQAKLAQYDEEKPVDSLSHDEKTVRAKIFFESGDYASAEHLFKQLHDLRPTSAELTLWLAKCYDAGSKPAEVAAILKPLLDAGSLDAEGSFFLAKSSVLEKDIETALASTRRMLLLVPTAEILDRTIMFAKYLEDNEAVLDAFTVYLEKNQEDWSSRLSLIGHLLAYERYESALAEISKLAARVPAEQLNDLSVFAGQALISLDRYQATVDALVPRLADQSLPEAHRGVFSLLIGTALSRLGKVDDAERYLMAAARTRTLSSHHAVRELLLGYESSGQGAKAHDALQELVSLSADLPLEHLAHYATLKLTVCRDLPAAIALFESMKPAHQATAAYWYFYSQLHHRAGDVRKAIELAEKALERDGEHPQALDFVAYGLSLLACDLGTALDSALLANELSPDNGPILDSIGRVFFKMGDYDRAIKYLREADSVMPGRTEILERLGDAYSASRKWRKAFDTYKSIDLRSRDDDARRRLRLKIETASAEM